MHRALLDGLAKAGFKTNLGIDGTGVLQLSLTRAGGYCFGKPHDDTPEADASHRA